VTGSRRRWGKSARADGSSCFWQICVMLYSERVLIPTAFTPHVGSFKDVTWRKVEVGQIVKVEDEELFPADLLCLASALPDDVCFIRTTNLDGETNLKVRRWATFDYSCATCFHHTPSADNTCSRRLAILAP